MARNLLFFLSMKRAAAFIGLLACLLSMVGAAEAFDGTVVRTTLKVERIACSACMRHIRNALRGRRGVTGMRADLRHALVMVDHEPGLGGGAIAELITALGYPAVVMDEQVVAATDTMGFPPVGRGVCGAAASAWKELFHRFF